MKKLIVFALAVIVGLCFSQPSRAAMEQGDKKFEVTGEVRFRGDYTEDAVDFNADSAVDDAGVVWPWRVRAAIHGNFSRNVSAHVEFQNFGFAGDGDNGINSFNGSSGGNTELYQGWLELGDIGGGSFDLRMGRQELVYGSEMLLGDFDFYNGATHDGFRAAWQYKKWTLDVFYTKVDDTVGFGPEIFPTSNGPSDTNFYGAYAVFKAPKKLGFDAYGLILQDATDEHRTTLGGRVYSKWDSNWAYGAELAYQTGEFESTSTDIKAYGFEGELSYQWRKSKIRPRVYGRYSRYTGDDPSTTDDEAFNPLFQDFHARNGYADAVRATDLDIIRAGVSWSGKDDRHLFGVDLLNFTLNETAAGADDGVGTELDLYYKYAYSRNVDITAAIASFQPGDIFDSASPTTPVSGGAVAPDVTATGDDSAMRVYVNTRLRF